MVRTAVLGLGILLCACASEESEPAKPKEPVNQSTTREPDRIAVDHILIAVRNPKMPEQTRTTEEGRKLAYDLLKQIREGADWARLKRQYSGDPPPGGPYRLANHGVAPAPGEYARSGMVRAFGDVGFGLGVGEIGMADHHATNSPYGFHIIKRVE